MIPADGDVLEQAKKITQPWHVPDRFSNLVIRAKVPPKRVEPQPDARGLDSTGFDRSQIRHSKVRPIEQIYLQAAHGIMAVSDGETHVDNNPIAALRPAATKVGPKKVML